MLIEFGRALAPSRAPLYLLGHYLVEIRVRLKGCRCARSHGKSIKMGVLSIKIEDLRLKVLRSIDVYS